MPYRKPLPPYGRQLFEAGLKHVVVFPPDALPDDFYWAFLAGQELSLINTGGYADYETLKELAVLLVQSGAKNVGLIDLDHALHWFMPRRKAA